ncbi:sensitive to high expression protein 9 [Coprinopsis sp. MPI-PUGE-AT-0042]|nr:sensitive to high expression protein 9 [Coprinopsis sp. MPI-PUGE-AT-0042]
MLRSSLRRSLGRQGITWRLSQARAYSTEQRPRVLQEEIPQSSNTASAESDSAPAALAGETQPASSPSTSSPESFPSKLDFLSKLKAPTPAELDAVKQRIREWTEQTAVAVRTRADGFTAETKTTFSQLGQHLNKVTGYEEIEALKRDVVEQENRINQARQAARKAKIAYEEAVLNRSTSQREVNDLLQRKSMWTDHDVSRFTTLVREDHLHEQEEARAKTAAHNTEEAVEKEFSQLMRLILARYHEEQVWSDKIRSASTYGQLAVLGLNLVVFILAIVLVEPWKRKRLAQTFERKVDELSADYAMKLEENMSRIQAALAGQEALLMGVAESFAEGANAEAQIAAKAALELEVAVEEMIGPLSEPVAVSEPPEEVWHLPWKPPIDSLTQRTWELSAVGAGALIFGVVGSIIFNR